MPMFLNVLKFISLLKSVAGKRHSAVGVKKNKKNSWDKIHFWKLDIPSDGGIRQWRVGLNIGLC